MLHTAIWASTNRLTCPACAGMGSKNTDCKAELAIFACPAAYINNKYFKRGRNP